LLYKIPHQNIAQSEATHTVDCGPIPTAPLAVCPVTYLLVSVLLAVAALDLSAIKFSQTTMQSLKYILIMLKYLVVCNRQSSAQHKIKTDSQ